MTTIYTNNPLDQIGQRLEGTVYIGVAGPDSPYIRATNSIHRMTRWDGDSYPEFVEFTKGAEAREYHTQIFLQSKHDFLLYLDGDMEFPRDALERLRAHGLPCVSGLAFRRTYDPTVLPAWTEDDPEFRWPMMPFRATPEEGRLYRLGATGFFCWLVHRSVFEAVQPILKGESFVQEDDMDVWPYDAQAVIDGKEQLRPLRMRKDRVGADLRLSYFIRRAGFTIWGDPDVMCGHYLRYPLGIKDWSGQTRQFREAFARGTEFEIEQLRQSMQGANS